MLLTYASSEDDDTQSYAFLYVLYSLGQQENASLKAKFSVVSSSVSALDEHAHYLVAANTSFSRQASVFMIVRQRGAKVWLHTKTIITCFQLSKLLYVLNFCRSHLYPADTSTKCIVNAKVAIFFKIFNVLKSFFIF